MGGRLRQNGGNLLHKGQIVSVAEQAHTVDTVIDGDLSGAAGADVQVFASASGEPSSKSYVVLSIECVPFSNSWSTLWMLRLSTSSKDSSGKDSGRK